MSRCFRSINAVFCDFSTHTYRGIIIFGISESDSFEVTGVDDVQALQKSVMEQCEQMEPAVRAIFTVVDINGKNVVSAEIPPVDVAERPCFYKGKGRIRGSYVCVGDADKPMTEYEVYSYVQPLIDKGLIQLSVPDAPSGPNQKYYANKS